MPATDGRGLSLRLVPASRKPGLHSQQEPSPVIGEGNETEGFARKVEGTERPVFVSKPLSSRESRHPSASGGKSCRGLPL
jgi:hypothetical protein